MIDINEARERILAAGKSWVKGSPDYAGRETLMQLLGVTDHGARSILKKLNDGEPLIEEQPEVEEVEAGPLSGATITKTSTSQTISIPCTLVQTEEELIKVCKIDTKRWELFKLEVRPHQMGSIPRVVGSSAKGWSRKSTDPVRTQLFSLHAIFRLRSMEIAAEAALKKMIESAATMELWHSVNVIPRPAKSSVLAQISMSDFHYASMSWSKETGWEDWDIPIATDIFMAGVERLAKGMDPYEPERYLFVAGSDFFHSDSPMAQTTAGTRQDVDSRYCKMVITGNQLHIRALDYLRSKAPVDVVVLPGNHDRNTCFHMGLTLEAWYRNCPDIQFDNTPLPRRYYQWGNVMLMMQHGDHGNIKNYLGKMSIEQPAMWARAKWREAQSGHLHTERQMVPKCMENDGVLVRSLPSLTPPNAWSSDEGYVGNVRRSEALAFHKQNCLIGTSVYSVLPDREKHKPVFVHE